MNQLFVGYIYLFSWRVIGIFNSLWFVIYIFNFSWSVNRQLTVNCDCIVLFTVNGDCQSKNPVNCDLNITRDTWFRLLSVKYLGVAEICIRRIAQNVPILILFSNFFRGTCPRTTPLFRSYTGFIHPTSKIDATEWHGVCATGLISCLLICKPRGVDRSGRSRWMIFFRTGIIFQFSLSELLKFGLRRDDHYIDAYMTLLHIWWLINRIKTYRFGLSIDIGHDGVIDHM